MRQMRILPLGLMAVILSAAGCSPSASKPRIKTYNLGDRVQAGSLVFQVYEAKWQTQFGEGPTAKIPKNRFLVIRLNVVNSGATESMVPTLSLADDSGQTYVEMSDVEGLPQWLGFLRKLKPAESMQGNIVFDVSPRHYKLRVEDDSGQEKYAWVDIPLSFALQTPELVNPDSFKPGIPRN